MSFPKKHTPKEAFKKLMRYCTYRERCHKEVKQKLYDLQIHPADQEEIIVKLIQEGFLNEERFAKIFAYDKFYLNHWGKYRIRKQMEFLQISEYLIRKAMQEIDEEDYLKTFHSLIEKRIKATKGEEFFTRKRKIADYLLRKGYESEMVYEQLGKLEL